MTAELKLKIAFPDYTRIKGGLIFVHMDNGEGNENAGLCLGPKQVSTSCWLSDDT